METRWSLRNPSRPITYAQFFNLTCEFKAAVEKSFGTPCAIEIDVLNAPKMFLTTPDDAAERHLTDINDRARTMKTESLRDITEQVWNEAGYVEVALCPIHSGGICGPFCATAEFKGNKPLQVTFSVTPDDQRLANHSKELHLKMVGGDGLMRNGTAVSPSMISSLIAVPA